MSNINSFMKNFYKNLKTSDKITFLFSIFNFVSLIILLFWINIIYFFIWYSDQRDESLYDMNKNYSEITWVEKNNIEAFKDYILKKDTLIIPVDGSEIICSNWVETKIHDDINKIKDKYFYKTDEKIFFIYSKTYPDIWEVKVFFDTTSYVKSQIIIIKMSFFIILFGVFFYIIIWKRITKYSLKNLNNIKEQAKNLDIEHDFKKIKIVWNVEDEINILAITINNSFSHIKKQTSNLKQFTDDVAHEFKTPLMVINSRIDLYNKKLEKNKLNNDDTKILIFEIKESTKKLNNLLETFLFLSRVENNIENLEKKEFNFNKILKKYTQDYLNNNNILDSNINIKYDFACDVKISIEENTFKILFENILSNAIKFSKKNDIEIEIWLSKNGFWIKDNWIWINDEDLKNIWNKFFRKDNKIEGFWIGLFLVKRLTNLYKWEIKIESKKNIWTKFMINF